MLLAARSLCHVAARNIGCGHAWFRLQEVPAKYQGPFGARLVGFVGLQHRGRRLCCWKVSLQSYEACHSSQLNYGCALLGPMGNFAAMPVGLWNTHVHIYTGTSLSLSLSLYPLSPSLRSHVLEKLEYVRACMRALLCKCVAHHAFLRWRC